WTIIREVVFAVSFTYMFGIMFGWGLTGIWAGLALGRIIPSILNFIFARYTIKIIRKRLDV
ncbi:MAG TPA: MATE family efflux transporter, partial [Methanosphaera sp.]|nr:MATE family efflux transporter [Methanosphaera sp.]